MKEIEEYFSEIRNKRIEESRKAEEDKKQKREALKQQAAARKLDKNFLALSVSKACTQNFKSQTRDGREYVMAKLDHAGNGAPDIGKYNPRFEALRA